MFTVQPPVQYKDPKLRNFKDQAGILNELGIYCLSVASSSDYFSRIQKPKFLLLNVLLP